MPSRLDQAKDAVRPALYGRVMLAGPPGSGKTRTALIIATALLEDRVVNEDGTRRIVVIDTERESALTYADDFVFRHLPWEPPFDPRDLAHTVLDAGKLHDVIIVDSTTHFWRYEGGTLDIADGAYTGWKEARPAQDDMVRAVLRTDAHVILCTRSKMKHEQVQENGKWKVNKLGMAPIQDDDLEYEMNVSLTLDMGHQLSVAKSRTTTVPVGREYKPGRALEFAETYREWLAGGEPPADHADLDALRERIKALGTPELRKACRGAFVAELCKPDYLRASQVQAASDLIARFEAEDAELGGGGGSPLPDPEAAEPPAAASGTTVEDPGSGAEGQDPQPDPAPEPSGDQESTVDRPESDAEAPDGGTDPPAGEKLAQRAERVRKRAGK